MDLQGEFQVQEIDIGKNKKDQSYARLLVNGKNQKHLDEILQTIYREGAVSKVQKEIILKKFITKRPARFEVDEGPAQINAVVFSIDTDSGKCKNITRIRKLPK